MTQKTHFAALAAYNAWANERLYTAAATLPDEAYRRDLGLFFRSVHGTLNHLLTTDRIWLKRLTKSGAAPDRLDAILFEDFAGLRAARNAEDERLSGFIAGLTEADFDKNVDYQNIAGKPYSQPCNDLLTHLFNHQTHHRGQAHTGLSLLGIAPPPLDMLMLQQGR